MHKSICIEVCCQVAARSNYRGYPHDTLSLYTHFYSLHLIFEILEKEKKSGGKSCSFWIFGIKGDRYRSTTLIIAFRIATLPNEKAERQEYFWEYVKPAKNVSNQLSILTSNFQCQKFIPLKPAVDDRFVIFA